MARLDSLTLRVNRIVVKEGDEIIRGFLLFVDVFAKVQLAFVTYRSCNPDCRDRVRGRFAEQIASVVYEPLSISFGRMLFSLGKVLVTTMKAIQNIADHSLP